MVSPSCFQVRPIAGSCFRVEHSDWPLAWACRHGANTSAANLPLCHRHWANTRAMLSPLIRVLVLLALVVLTTACFRSPRLLSGVFVTVDGRVERLEPAAIRSDYERRLALALSEELTLSASPSVIIREQPVAVGDEWRWVTMNIAIAGVRAAADRQTAEHLLRSALVPDAVAEDALTIQFLGGQ